MGAVAADRGTLAFSGADMKNITSAFAALLAAACLGLAWGCDTGAQDAQEDAALASTEPTAARGVQKEYEANEVAADMKFKGKRLLFTGTVQEISKDLLDDIYIQLVGTDEFSSPHAYFGDTDKAAIAQLRKGQKIAFTGAVDGFVMGSVMIRGCRLQKEAAAS
jgi:hypothetical protein